MNWSDRALTAIQNHCFDRVWEFSDVGDGDVDEDNERDRV